MATHLLTGFPGFIGRRLVAALLARDPDVRIVAIVEQRMLEPARTAAAELGDERIEVLAGDIAERRLGLGDDDYGRLLSEVAIVHHLAAIYDLAVPAEIAQRVNVEGTGNVLDLCRDAEALERLNYVSTAYVAGDRTGVAYEHELNLGQGFKNHYESTKFQAEVWVRELIDKIPTTIFRPAIVVGDSRTGETQKFDGPYYALRFIAASVARGMPIANIGRGRTPFNVVPVDFIVDSMVELGALDEAVGETRPPLRSRSAQLTRDVHPALRALRQAQAGLPDAAPGRGCGVAHRPDPRALRRHSLAVDPLSEPSGPLRHAQGD